MADISINLAGNPSINYAGATVVTHLLDYGSTRFEMGYASAIATILFLLMVGTNKLVQNMLRGLVTDEKRVIVDYSDRKWVPFGKGQRKPSSTALKLATDYCLG